MNIAIIPARGGSKRIPKKNIKDFLGKPIISYSIVSAINSGLFDEVMVSTDSDEIADIAKKFGATVPFLRNAKTSDDFATTSDVILEVLGDYSKRGKFFDYLCCIYPTAPFVTVKKLKKAFDKLKEQNVDAVVPLVPFTFPPLRGHIVENNFAKLKWPENLNKRSQDLETMYHDCGQFYCLRTQAFLQEKTLFCKNTVPLILSELEVQDIDNEIDWELAEMKFRLMDECNLV